MFNVLTKDIKNEIRSMYKMRRFLMYFIIFDFILLLLLSIFFSMYLLIKTEKKNMQIEADFVMSSKNFKDSDWTAKTFDETNKYLIALSKENSSFYLGEFVQDLLLKKNNGIRLSELIYVKTTASSSVITLHGIASRRESLLSFVKELSSDLSLKVNLPVSNFAKEKDIDFSFDIIKTHESKQ